MSETATLQPAPSATMTPEQLDRLSINTIRTLSIDAVQQANSGHPGTPMALAPLVYTLWNRVLRFDPLDPIWPNRDRFVLSNGHGWARSGPADRSAARDSKACRQAVPKP